jgi:hypothetical protein
MMKISLGQFLLAFVVLCCSCVWAQTDTGTPDANGPKPAYTYDDQTPPTQPGPKPAYTYPDTTPSLDFLTQSIENSSITLGIGAGFSYDSNAYAIGTTNSNWWLFHVTPSIRIQQFFPKFSWNAGYSGGYQRYAYESGPGNSNNNLFSQIANAGFLWQMSPHWQLSGNDNFRYSANPFDSYLTAPGTPTMNNPNPIVYTPLTQFTQNYGLLTLTDRLTKVDTLSFSGTANLRRTSTYNLLTSVPFYNLVSYGGRASYAHQLSPRLTLGAGYDYNTLDFGKGQQRSGIQTITATIDYVIRPNMTVSGWIGPEYTTTKTIVVLPIIGPIITHDTLWSTAVGANFGWSGARNSMRAGFSRHVSDGSGLIGTSQVNSFNADYRRQIAKKWDGVLGGNYYHDVSTTLTTRSFNNFYISAVLNYQISKSFYAAASYSHAHLSQSNAFIITNGTYDANIVGASITYSWNHPLGR